MVATSPATDTRTVFVAAVYAHVTAASLCAGAKQISPTNDAAIPLIVIHRLRETIAAPNRIRHTPRLALQRTSLPIDRNARQQAYASPPAVAMEGRPTRRQGLGAHRRLV